MANPKRTIEIIGVPSDLGANVRGANMGPSALRAAGLSERIQTLGFTVFDAGDVNVPVRETLSEQTQKDKFLPAIETLCRDLAFRTHRSLSEGRLPLIIGGDHSQAAGSIAGVHEYFSMRNESFGLIWIDAHGDLNSPTTSPSGNIHGMPLATLLGDGHKSLVGIGNQKMKLSPDKVALIGIRTLDAAEKETVRRCGIRYFTMREIDERGMHSVMNEALAIVTNNTQGVHLSFDIDGIDPLYAPGVSTPVMGGLSYREAHLALEMMADSGLIRSLEFVEVNPMTDNQHKTVDLTIELIQSALGKTIV